MKNTYIIGNWKSNKTVAEAKQWFQEAHDLNMHVAEHQTVIVCVPYHLLPLSSALIQEFNLPFHLGAQDVSPFPTGAYTGAIAAEQLKDFVEYGLVGHSERRKYFHETDNEVIQKVKQLLAYDINPVLCISDLDQLKNYMHADNIFVTNAEKIIFVYEPPSAISGGGAYHAEEPEVIDRNASEISNIIGKAVTTIYGGSVNPENASAIFSLEHIYGGLPGQASLNPTAFANIISHA